MERNFDRALKLVLQHEGGYVNHPKDPGGATNKGVTIATFRRYVDKDGTVDDLRRITDAQVAQVYRKHYWDAVKADDLPDGLDYAVFDFAVNSGPSRAAKYLQKVLKVTQDGKIGPMTLAAANRAPLVETIQKLMDERLAFLKRLSTWKTFGKGWSNRVAGVRASALTMSSAVTQELRQAQQEARKADAKAGQTAEEALQAQRVQDAYWAENPKPVPVVNEGGWATALCNVLVAIFKKGK